MKLEKFIGKESHYRKLHGSTVKSSEIVGITTLKDVAGKKVKMFAMANGDIVCAKSCYFD